MHKIALGLVALTLAATPAFSQAPLSFADVDTDTNGELSFAELQAVWSDIGQEEFDAADRDASGGLDPAELNALQPSTLPAPLEAPDSTPETISPASGG
ncbi:MAG: hypothetical protein ABS75_20985 [Pelagibacterium sp. SCN 63-23]|nr:MAG: hypothetical protein ABS75_20985 [Pelagibacterium sp. SCN 63-23]